MKKIDEICKYINENMDKNPKMDKEVIIPRVAKKYKVSPDTARTYYYAWKKKYMKGANCVPKKTNLQVKQAVKEKPKKEKVNKETRDVNNYGLKIEEATVIKGKYGIYIKDKNKVIAGDIIFKDAEDIEEYRKKEMDLFYKRLSEIMDVMNLEV